MAKLCQYDKHPGAAGDGAPMWCKQCRRYKEVRAKRSPNRREYERVWKARWRAARKAALGPGPEARMCRKGLHPRNGGRCRPCRNAYAAKYRLEHLERSRERKRASQAKYYIARRVCQYDKHPGAGREGSPMWCKQCRRPKAKRSLKRRGGQVWAALVSARHQAFQARWRANRVHGIPLDNRARKH